MIQQTPDGPVEVFPVEFELEKAEPAIRIKLGNGHEILWRPVVAGVSIYIAADGTEQYIVSTNQTIVRVE